MSGARRVPPCLAGLVLAALAALVCPATAIQLTASDVPVSFALPAQASAITLTAQLLNCTSNASVALCIMPLIPPPRNGWTDSCTLLLTLGNCSASISADVGLPGGTVWLALNASVSALVDVQWTVCDADQAGPDCSQNVTALQDVEAEADNATAPVVTYDVTLTLPAGEAYYSLSLASATLLPAQLNLTLSLLAPLASVSVAVRRGYLPTAALNTAHVVLASAAPVQLSLPSPPLGAHFLLFNASAPCAVALALSAAFCPPARAGPACNINDPLFYVNSPTVWSVAEPAALARLSIALSRNATPVPLPTLELLAGNAPSDVFFDARVGASAAYPVAFLALPALPPAPRYFLRLSDFAAPAIRVAVWLNDVCPARCHAPAGRCAQAGPALGTCDCSGTVVMSAFDCSGALPRRAESAILIVLLCVTAFAALLGLAHYFWRRHKLIQTGYATLR